MQLIIKSKVFLVSALVVTVAIFAALINLSKTPQSQIDVIFIAKNQSIDAQMGTVVNNAREITKTLSFYNDMVRSADQISGKSIQFPAYSKESDWASKVNIERQDSSGIIRISVSDTDQSRAELLAKNTALNLARKLSLFYNIRTELDTRIVSGPINSSALSYNVFVLAIYSIISGFVLTFIIFIISALLSDLILKSYFLRQPKIVIPGISTAINVPESEPYIFKPEPKKQPEKTETLEKKSLVFEHTLPSHSPKAAAPDNLPIADTSSLFSVSEKPNKETIQDVPKITAKATPEEVKERLNKLLSGRI